MRNGMRMELLRRMKVYFKTGELWYSVIPPTRRYPSGLPNLVLIAGSNSVPGSIIQGKSSIAMEGTDKGRSRWRTDKSERRSESA
jgi:hypothetical protein